MTKNEKDGVYLINNSFIYSILKQRKGKDESIESNVWRNKLLRLVFEKNINDVIGDNYYNAKYALVLEKV